jgi:hypothetical protein
MIRENKNSVYRILIALSLVVSCRSGEEKKDSVIFNNISCTTNKDTICINDDYNHYNISLPKSYQFNRHYHGINLVAANTTIKESEVEVCGIKIDNNKDSISLDYYYHYLFPHEIEDYKNTLAVSDFRVLEKGFSHLNEKCIWIGYSFVQNGIALIRYDYFFINNKNIYRLYLMADYNRFQKSKCNFIVILSSFKYSNVR